MRTITPVMGTRACWPVRSRFAAKTFIPASPKATSDLEERLAPARAVAWQTVTDRPSCAARNEAALTAMNGKLYSLGGRGVQPVEEYSPQANTRKSLAPRPMQLHHIHES